ncbi:hypothetical protein D3C85_982830 [compost metagenome]
MQQAHAQRAQHAFVRAAGKGIDAPFVHLGAQQPRALDAVDDQPDSAFRTAAAKLRDIRAQAGAVLHP